MGKWDVNIFGLLQIAQPLPNVAMKNDDLVLLSPLQALLHLPFPFMAEKKSAKSRLSSARRAAGGGGKAALNDQ